MKEYIERAAVLKVLEEYYPGVDERLHIVKDITSIPTAEVAEVKHGRWEFLGPNRLIKGCMCGTCSVCHIRSKYIENTAICPNCSARMDKEDEHDQREICGENRN